MNVNGGTFTMTGNSKISGNEATGSYDGGGGVLVSSGTFTMSDNSEISNNTACATGGGVNVRAEGVFEMNGGTIGGVDEDGNPIGNTLYTSTGGNLYGGGGVCVFGTFTMTDGEISNKKAS